jgi:hypothetical protein
MAGRKEGGMASDVMRANYENERANTPEPFIISITTRVPSKWRFVDLETGDVWEWLPVSQRFVQAKLPPNFREKRS